MDFRCKRCEERSFAALLKRPPVVVLGAFRLVLSVACLFLRKSGKKSRLSRSAKSWRLLKLKSARLWLLLRRLACVVNFLR